MLWSDEEANFQADAGSSNGNVQDDVDGTYEEGLKS